jgi:hypothetical protein
VPDDVEVVLEVEAVLDVDVLMVDVGESDVVGVGVVEVVEELVGVHIEVLVDVGVGVGVHAELEDVVGWPEPSLNHHDP